MDGDGDVDFVTTRGNSTPYDGVLWLEQVRTGDPVPSFDRAREVDSPELESYHESRYVVGRGAPRDALVEYIRSASVPFSSPRRVSGRE